MDIRSINRDIMLDSFGDIIFEGGDIVTSTNENSIAKVNAMHRIMSNHGDLYLHFPYGADIQKFIGKGLTESTAETIKLAIETSLSEDMFLLDNMYSVQYVIDTDKIYFKISVGTSDDFMGNKNNEINISISSTGAIAYV